MTRHPTPAEPVGAAPAVTGETWDDGLDALRSLVQREADATRHLFDRLDPLGDARRLLAAAGPLPLRRPPDDPELLALKEAERARRRGRIWPVPGEKR